ncbi:MAG: pyridoxamine 5'-phosphate oxidase family protein [Firmicutes bacterium]|nr:pyridoxamine 5'-phosphate oxidase family protein [Bacillota bacterium]
MFRQMRRKNQILSQEESIAILQNGTTGTLAVLGDDDYPYAVPINYFYEDNKIYFHGAKAGHKIDAIKKHNKVSFCVVAQDDIITEKFTTYFKSVIAFGTARIIEDDAEKRNAIEKLTVKFTPDQTEQKRSEAIEKEFPALGMVEMTIEHMTGKQALELIKK